MAFTRLTPRQEEDLEFLRTHTPAAALWHEVGVGKTHPTIVRVLELLHGEGEWKKSALIVMKRALFQQWIEKIQEVARALQYPNINIRVVTGGVEPPNVLPQIVLCNYDIIGKLEDWVTRNADKWAVCVLDEAHKIKGFRGYRSRHGARAKVLNKLSNLFPVRIALSGSPILNPNSSDVWAIYHWLDNRIFGPSRHRFVSEFFYNLAMGQPYERLVMRPGMAEEVSRRMYTIARRVLKAECTEGEFPDLCRIPYYAEMPPDLSKKYHELRKSAIVTLDVTGDDGEIRKQEITRAHLLGRLMSLQQIASGWVTEQGEVIHVNSYHKMEILEDILEEIGADAPVIVWAHFRHEIEFLEKWFTQKRRKPVVLYGQISAKEQIERIQRFKDGRADTFIGQPAAAGAGLDLQRAQHAIRFSRSYIPEDFEQSEGRNNRAFSLFKNTTHHEIIAQGTRDADVYEALRDKKDLSSMLTLDFLEKGMRNA